MSVTVSPEAFTFVDYDAGEIISLAEKSAADARLEDAEVHVDVVESTPLGRAAVAALSLGSPARVELRIEGGAFESLKVPRRFDPTRAAETLGRLLLRAADMLDGRFGFAGDFGALAVPRQVAWDVYSVGRLERRGYKVSRDRWLYLWRNRHGFTDDSDLAFEKLWSVEPLTWREVRSVSEALKPDEAIAPTGRSARPERA